MEQRVSMEKPVCLIDTERSGRMFVTKEALEILEMIGEPVVVVAVVGLYRTGKSYLMNRLASRQNGFALGSTIESETKGIWMWCVPHPTKPGHTLVLLDTEGLGDVEKGDEKHDTWIFCLAVLLSSTLVYNSMGTIDNNALEKLHYVTELTEHIKVKSEPGDDDQASKFMSVFPTFVWTVRDFTLQLVRKGQPISSDEYLDHALELKPGSSPKTEKFNMPRRCLRDYFAVRKCFVFERPASGEKLAQMEQLTDSDLEPKFVRQATEFCSYVLGHTQAKAMDGGMQLTGRMLGSLAETYVEAIRSGQVPCLDSAVESLAMIQNARAVTDAVEFYIEEMMSHVQLPTDTRDVLSGIHAMVEKDALAVFLKAAFNDRNQTHQTDLMHKLYAEYEQICKQNEETSRQVSLDTISRVFGPVEQAVKAGSYTRRGGYNAFQAALQSATQQYKNSRGCGVMSEKVLSDYLTEKETVGKNILGADQSLTRAEHDRAVEQMRAQAAEQQKRYVEDQNRYQRTQMEEQQRSYEENQRQLMQKMEQERVRAQQDSERVLNSRLREQKDMMEQGFQQRAHDMQRQIDSLSCRLSQSRSSGPTCCVM
ncbi:guanylate-binding protein 1-like [Denticeps clupeoides]|uniref:GB1/RHD3-type G domain-containing protein n=1 Tax=Denticeps clupeoides TaxID=299321 RepID=A0AAY3ZT20_9TELE|nr:guanylate-binding protein 1-like [Denticeps clupeoides]